MRMAQADLIDDMLASAPKQEGTDGLIEAAGQHASVRFSIEEICNGEWSIGGKSTSTVTSRLPGAGAKGVTRGDSGVTKRSNLQVAS